MVAFNTLRLTARLEKEKPWKLGSCILTLRNWVRPLEVKIQSERERPAGLRNWRGGGWRTGKQHVVPDALSRLTQAEPQVIPGDGQLDLDALHGATYHVTLVEMSDEFKKRLIAEYVKDPQWNKVLDVVKKSMREATSETPEATPKVTETSAQESTAVPIPELRTSMPEDDAVTRRVGLR